MKATALFVWTIGDAVGVALWACMFLALIVIIIDRLITDRKNRKDKK